MKYVCRITKSGGQARITLPRGFMENRRLDERNYVIIDDRKRGQAIIKGVAFEELNNGKRKASRNRADR
ncbi:MAG: hypothetical protein E3J94_02820 [Desulfobacteraceae bacterium]|nr:MAG: hypothetical protein E3J94_02820 [Desulfobacteraceae bacterium]